MFPLPTYNEIKEIAISAKDDLASIRQDVLLETDSNTDLAAINNTSNTSIFKLIIDIVSFLWWILMQQWEMYYEVLSEAARAAIPHNTYWYSKIAKQYQHGDLLEVNDEGWVGYLIENEANRIIEVASIKNNEGGKVYIKVAKSDGAGGLIKLDDAEKLGFNSYINKIKDAGVKTVIVSQNANKLRLDMVIYYDPIVPLQTFQSESEAAINSYRDNFDFDGVLRLIRLKDAIQKVNGCIDIDLNLAEIGTNEGENYVSFDTFIELSAGYFELADDSNIQYLPSF